MEVYELENSIIDYPKPIDCSLDVLNLYGYFGRRAKEFCKSTSNKYLLSIENDWFCIVPSRGDTFRVIGQCDVINAVKHTINYDVFFVGSFDECREKWLEFAMSAINCRALLLF